MTLYVGNTLLCNKAVCEGGERSEVYMVGVHTRVLSRAFLGMEHREVYGSSTRPCTLAVPHTKKRKMETLFLQIDHFPFSCYPNMILGILRL